MSDEIEATARRMRARYSTPAKAAEMAHLHGMDYPEGTKQREFWDAVKALIPKLARTPRERD